MKEKCAHAIHMGMHTHVEWKPGHSKPDVVVTEFNVSVSGSPEPAPPTPAQETQGHSWRSLEDGPVSSESPHLPKGPTPLW